MDTDRGLYRALFDHALTRIDPERAHELAFTAIRTAGPALSRRAPKGEPVERMGLRFPARLGLAAGFDKNGVGIDALAGLGFGFVEIGTVTGEPQPGNPRPRLARLPADRAVVNRMGFNNDGAEAVAARLQRRLDRLRDRRGGRTVTAGRPVLGINIGKTKVVPDHDEAAVLADYRKSARLLAPYADYLVVNVSSPNTPGLRDLQAVERLEPLLRAVREQADASTPERDRAVPLLVKIAPDLGDEDVLAVADLAVASALDGVIATNTTIARTGLRSSAPEVDAAGPGGLSGAPLRQRATDVVRMLRDRAGTGLTLVGAGGISDPATARERLDAGADLLQAYTAFVYEGPTWPARVNRALAERRGRR
ncbi:MAG TPA: quinone-dependent dihydroorotate dehydrogenase [Nocardioidaceae bacterium]|nr:quinone-dependent dihydroorotate dehydrogenase [Nocardioidaceae bacterium]